MTVLLFKKIQGCQIDWAVYPDSFVSVVEHMYIWLCLFKILHKHNMDPQRCKQVSSHTWWITQWPDFLYLQRHLRRWRSMVHQAPTSLLQSVIASILPSEVLSAGSESEKQLQFNLLCRSISALSVNISIHAPGFVVFSLLPPWRQTLTPFFPLMPPLLVLSLPAPCLVLAAAALRALGLWLGLRRTGCKTETNSELGQHCLCVRTCSADKKLDDKRRRWCLVQN